MKCLNMKSDMTINLFTNLPPVSVELTSSKQAINWQATLLVMVATMVMLMIDVIAVLEVVEKNIVQEYVSERN